MALRLPNPQFFAPASIGGAYGQAVNVYRGLTAGQLANAQLRETLARQQAMEDLYGGLDEAYKKQKEIEELNKRLGILEKAADDYEKGLISEGALRQVYDEHVAPFTGIGFEQFVEAPKNFQQSTEAIANLYGVQEGTPAYSALVQRGGGAREEAIQYLRKTKTPSTTKPQLKLVQDQTSATGWSWADAISGDVVLKDAPPPREGVSVNVGAGETAFRKKMGEHYGNIMTKFIEGGNQAMSDIQVYNEMENLLKEIPSGIAVAALLPVKQWAASLGIKIDEKLPQQEAFNAFAKQLAIRARSPEGGFGGMPGQLSDNDIKFLEDMMPSLKKTKEGNLLIVRFLKNLARRRMEVADFVNTYMLEHPDATGAEVMRAVQRRFYKRPLLSQTEYNIAKQLAGVPKKKKRQKGGQYKRFEIIGVE